MKKIRIPDLDKIDPDRDNKPGLSAEKKIDTDWEKKKYKRAVKKYPTPESIGPDWRDKFIAISYLGTPAILDYLSTLSLFSGPAFSLIFKGLKKAVDWKLKRNGIKPYKVKL